MSFKYRWTVSSFDVIARTEAKADVARVELQENVADYGIDLNHVGRRRRDEVDGASRAMGILR